MRKRTPIGLVLLLVSLGPSAAEAQDEGSPPATFTSDRPGFANTPGVAAVGRLTAEVGVEASFDPEAPAGALPLLSLRVGLFPWLEARWRGPSAVGDFGPGGPRFGLADPSLGFKVGGTLDRAVSISSVWEVSVPLATDGFGSPESELFADLNFRWDFWGPLAVTLNTAATVLAIEDEATGETARLFDGGASVRFDWLVIDVFGIFVQSYVLKSEVSDWRVQVGGGVYWQVAQNVQVDAVFNTGVTPGDDEPPTAQIGTSVLF